MMASEVIQFLDEKSGGNLKYLTKNAKRKKKKQQKRKEQRKLTTAAIGKSEVSICKVRELNVVTSSGERLTSPGKKCKPHSKIIEFDDLDVCVIRQIIHNLYAARK
jgi:hypothetical protein